MKQNSYLSKGFSLVEVLVSLGTFGLFALLVQSVLVMGHSLRISHVNLIDTTQSVGVIKQIICSANSSFKMVGMDPNRTYSTPVSVGLKKRVYKKHSFVKEEVPFATLDLSKMSSQPADGFIHSTVNRMIKEQANLGDTTRFSSNRNVEFYPPNFKSPFYYKVFQDSHTIVKINTRQKSLSIQSVSGYIFASRCVENKKSSAVYKRKIPATFDSKAFEESALYILEKKERPFYFPNSKNQKNLQPAVRCCESGDSLKCQSGGKKNWVPRLYIIYLDILPIPSPPVAPVSSSTPNIGRDIYKKLENTFFVKVVHIQEEPEWQNINNVWSAGFVLTTKVDLNTSQSVPFSLNMMFLKNHCITSPLRIAKCPVLSFGIRPESLQILSSGNIGNLPVKAGGGKTTTYTMKDFIYPDVTGCSGYSNSLSSTSLIYL